MTFWESKSFKALQRAWYQRLKDEGFEDAEELIGTKLVLRQSAAHPYRGQDHMGIQIKEAYYHFLSQQIETAEFENDVDKLILIRHAEGRKICHIVAELEELGMGRARDTVRFRIRVYEMKWGIKQYTPKQLHQKVS